MIKPAYSVSFVLSINIFIWQHVLYFPNDGRIIYDDPYLSAYMCILSYTSFALNAVAQLVEALRCKPLGRGFDSR